MLKTPSVISSFRAVCGNSPDDLARGVDVAVREHFDRCAAQPRAVDDAGVVQLIGDHEVFLREDGRDGSGIGREPALKDDGRFSLLELREPPLQLHVNLHRARDRAHGSGADAELLQRRERFFLEPWMGRQSEVVVRGEVDDLAPVDSGTRGLLVVEHAQVAVEALRFERV